MTRFTIPALPCARTTAGKIDRTKPLRPKLVGYYTKGARPNWTRMNEYHAWKDHVREHAPAGLPQPTQGQPVRVDIWCWFADGTHNDPENVRKGRFIATWTVFSDMMKKRKPGTSVRLTLSGHRQTVRGSTK